MTILQSIILGIIQGITEFLPVSSSAHLVLTPYLLGWKIPTEQAFIFDVLVQVASLIGVVAVFWKDLIAIIAAVLRGLIHRKPFADQNARLGWHLALATIPAGLIGISIKDWIEKAFSSPTAVGLFLWVTAGLLIVAERIGGNNREMTDLTWKDSLWIGFAQVAAIFPGVSRSGATITGGMGTGLARPAAARFAFLMSIPIMLAAGLLAGNDLVKISGFQDLLPSMIPGFLASAVVSYFSIRWLLRFLANSRLYAFSIYCFLLGFFVLLTRIIH